MGDAVVGGDVAGRSLGEGVRFAKPGVDESGSPKAAECGRVRVLPRQEEAVNPRKETTTGDMRARRTGKGLASSLVLGLALAVPTVPLSAPAAGEAMLKLLKVLRDRGSLTEAEYQMLVEAAETDARAAGAAAPGVPAVTMPPRPGESAVPVPGSAASSGSGAAVDAAGSAAAGSGQVAAVAAAAVPKAKWFDRISFRGYAQIRYTEVLDQEGAELHVLNDASVSEASSFLMRRGRLILSGDVTDRLFVYLQSDFNASLGSGEYTLAMRDYYGDLALDEDQEFRLRFGQSKVPFGWVNLQSSQNRLTMERADALNTAVEGERDIGVFGYWAPAAIRARFRDLVRTGLKGSGDYGVAGLGVYSGQGLNRLDLNGEPHVVARLSYPWQLAGGQYFETGIAAYHGTFVSPVTALAAGGGGTYTPWRLADGVTDQRIGGTLVWYPQPFGLEAEWNVGRGPELAADRRAIESRFLHGGYVMANYRVQGWHGDWFPFVRWQYYDGGRKFAANAPGLVVNEWDVGVEWQPWPEFEVAISYTHTVERSNTRVAPYGTTEAADRIGFQAQINF